jgi:hypothetical protein
MTMRQNTISSGSLGIVDSRGSLRSIATVTQTHRSMQDCYSYASPVIEAN